MDTTLVTVTVLSMGMAAALSVIVWRLLRDERHRSEARVAALADAAFPSSALSSSALSSSALRATEDGRATQDRRASEGKPPTIRAIPEGGSYKQVPLVAAPALSERQRVEGPALSERKRVEGPADDLTLHPENATAATGALFAEPVRSSPWGNRLAVMTALALLGTSILLFAMAAARPHAAASAKNAPAAPAVERAAAGLELLSLRDSRDAGSLTITGMVQNPRVGSLLSRVAVTAYAFDEKGAFLASGRALIDVTSLAPGDESPFVVTVPVTGTVARYRIGFRGEDGRVIAHVDKRQQSPMAALQSFDGRPGS